MILGRFKLVVNPLQCIAGDDARGRSKDRFRFALKILTWCGFGFAA